MCPRFVVVGIFFPFVFLLFCHSVDNSTMITLLDLLDNLINVVRFLTEFISFLAKTLTESRRASLFGPSIVGAFSKDAYRRPSHRIGSLRRTVMAPRLDGKPPRPKYLGLHRGLEKANREFFSAVMKKSISNILFKLPVVVDAVVGAVI